MDAWGEENDVRHGPTLTRRKADRVGLLGRPAMADPQRQNGPVTDAQLQRAVADQRRRQEARRVGPALVRQCEYHMDEDMPCDVCGGRGT